jgi:transcriptional regulator with XRE-family HTH domain
MEPLGPKIRRMRRRAGFTLDELAVKTAISKPYLSLIETGRVPNPPSDEKLRRLEQALGFPPGELVTQAHLHRTPRDVRAVLQRLIEEGRKKAEANGESSEVGGQRSGKGEKAGKNGNGSQHGSTELAEVSALVPQHFEALFFVIVSNMPSGWGVNSAVSMSCRRQISPRPPGVQGSRSRAGSEDGLKPLPQSRIVTVSRAGPQSARSVRVPAAAAAAGRRSAVIRIGRLTAPL